MRQRLPGAPRNCICRQRALRSASTTPQLRIHDDSACPLSDIKPRDCLPGGRLLNPQTVFGFRVRHRRRVANSLCAVNQRRHDPVSRSSGREATAPTTQNNTQAMLTLFLLCSPTVISLMKLRIAKAGLFMSTKRVLIFLTHDK